MSWVLFGLSAAGAGVLLWLIGRASMTSDVKRHAAALDTMLDYHNDLTAFANGQMNNLGAIDDLIARTSRVTEALGIDNIARGVVIGYMLLNGVPLLPRALYALRDNLMSSYRHDEVYKIIEAVRGVLLIGMGRREHIIEKIAENSKNPAVVMGRGWSIVIAIPLHVLRGIGLIDAGQATRAVNSLLFKFVSLATFLAAIAGPVLAYLADRKNIESEVSRIASSPKSPAQPTPIDVRP
jgi:hypothetical protein